MILPMPPSMRSAGESPSNRLARSRTRLRKQPSRSASRKSDGSGPSFEPSAFNGRLFFSANDGTNGTELYVTDGTAAGTTRLTDLNPGAGSAVVFCSGTFTSVLSPTTGRLFFQATDGGGTHGAELHPSSGD